MRFRDEHYVIQKRGATGKYYFGMITHKVLENIKLLTNTGRATTNQNYKKIKKIKITLMNTSKGV